MLPLLFLLFLLHQISIVQLTVIKGKQFWRNWDILSITAFQRFIYTNYRRGEVDYISGLDKSNTIMQ